MSSYETSNCVIDNQGDLILNIIHSHQPNHNIILMRVSTKVLIQHSKIFHDKIKSQDFGTRSNLDLHGDDGDAVKFWMEVLHKSWRADHFTKTDVPLSTFCDAVIFGEKYGLDLLKLKVWWSFWLGNRDIESSTADEVDFMLLLCGKFGHQEGYKALQILHDERNGVMHPDIATAYKRFPPIFTMSRQVFEANLSRNKITTAEDYDVLAFSAMFVERYGLPMYYSDFSRLFNTPINIAAIPNIKTFQALMYKKTASTFLNFCRAVDNKANLNNFAPVPRSEMEASWAWISFELYDKSTEDDPGNANLTTVLRMRFHPKAKIEEYWQSRKMKNGWGDEDVERKEDGCDEPGDEEEEDDDDKLVEEGDGNDDDDDDDDDDDEVMQDLHEDFMGMCMGLSVGFLEDDEP